MAHVSLETLLDREQAALDGVMGEVRAGVRDHRHFDELEARVSGIAARMRAAFRKKRA